MVQARTLHWVIKRRQRYSPDQNWSFWSTVEEAYLLHDGNDWYLYDDSDLPPMWYEYEVHSPKEDEVQSGIIKLTATPDIHPDPAHALGTGAMVILTRQFIEGIYLNHHHIVFRSMSNSFQLVAYTSPSDATNKLVMWITNNPLVATVQNGLVIPKGSGTTTITAKSSDGGFMATCSVIVDISASNIGAFANAIEIFEGESIVLSAKIIEGFSENITVKWATDNYNIASVVSKRDTSAIVYGHRNGVAMINCVYLHNNKMFKSFKITVNEKPIDCTHILTEGIPPSIIPEKVKSTEEKIIAARRSFSAGINPTVIAEEVS